MDNLADFGPCRRSNLRYGHFCSISYGLVIQYGIIYSDLGFLEQGLLVKDVKRIKDIYYKSSQFRLDVLSVLPFDYLNLLIFNRPALLRFNRLLRRERLVGFMGQTETRCALPNIFRVGSVVWYIAVIVSSI